MLARVLGLALLVAPLAILAACSVCGVEFVGQNNPGKCADTPKTLDAGDAQATPLTTSTVTALPTPPPPPTPTLTALPMVACGGPVDAGDAAVVDGSVDASVCNSLGCAPPVDEQYVVGSMPSPIGGYIPAGTYALTALNNYGSGKTGPTGYVLQESFRYEGTMFDKVTSSGSLDAGVAQVGSVTRISGTYATSGTTITWTGTCNGGGIPVGYTIFGGQFRTFIGSREYIYSLQP